MQNRVWSLGWMVVVAVAVGACGGSEAPKGPSTEPLAAPLPEGAQDTSKETPSPSEAKPEAKPEPKLEAPPSSSPAAPLACSGRPGEVPEVFGAPLPKGLPWTSLSEIVAKPEAFAGRELLTKGVVRASCEKRGCWMEVRPEEDRAGEAITVRFKDYKFFVPLTSRGAHVVFAGKVVVKNLSAEEVEHLEGEGASVSGKQPDGTAKQVQFTATGVEMCGRSKG